MPASKLIRVPYAVDNDFFQKRHHSASFQSLRASLGLTPHHFVILFSGRLVPEKDPATLIRAVGRLVARWKSNPPGATSSTQTAGPVLLMVGDGELRPALQKLAQQHAPGSVQFLGFQSQAALPDYYALCDVLVLPSLFEPWGLVVNEAMNAAKPVIVSDHVGGGADLVEPGVNGFIFKAGHVDELSSSLEELANNDDLRLKAGAASLKKVRGWGYEQDVAGIKQALDRLQPLTPHAVKKQKAPSHHQTGGISLAYLGVHEIFQMAAAAAEMGRLDRFYCSLFDSPNSWGAWLKPFAPVASLSPFGAECLPHDRVTEVPLPLVSRRLVEKALGPFGPVDPLWSNRWFQRRVNRLDAHSSSQVVVGSETCALDWFQQARRRGAKCVLDCHGIPAPFLDAGKKRACLEFGLKAPLPSDSAEMTAYKTKERELADVIICCSELQRDKLLELGEDGSKMRAIPLWVDTGFWRPVHRTRVPISRPLKVVFAGACSVSKGLPYLLQAAKSLHPDVSLTLVGRAEPVIQRMLKESGMPVAVHDYMPRTRLRDLFSQHDVLVLPSLGDSFGFVAMEAMACGLPVIVSDRCGVPVPQESWRVPAFSAEAVAARLQFYLEHPERVAEDGVMAATFAAHFSAEDYRSRLRSVFEALLLIP